MKEYKYRGYDEAIKVDDNGNTTYRGREVEKYYHGVGDYNGTSASGFSIRQLSKQHYVSEMNRIDREIEREEYRKVHPEEFENLTTVDEDLDYFFNMINE